MSLKSHSRSNGMKNVFFSWFYYYQSFAKSIKSGFSCDPQTLQNSYNVFHVFEA